MKKVRDVTIYAEEGEQAYGMLFWRGRYDSLSAVGRYGQYGTIVPEKDLVVAVNSFNETGDSLLEYVWTYLYPYL